MKIYATLATSVACVSTIVSLVMPTETYYEPVVETIPLSEMIDHELTTRFNQYIQDGNAEIETLLEQQDLNTTQMEQEDVIVESDTITYLDIPLSIELQQYVQEKCQSYYIEPTLVYAIIEKESMYDSNKIGDHGNSLGLMQIQPRWHQARMARVGCEDLLNAFDNVAVGIDILSDLFDRYGNTYGINYVLMCYNGGEGYAKTKWAQGIVSTQYVEDVLKIKEKLDACQQ